MYIKKSAYNWIASLSSTARNDGSVFLMDPHFYMLINRKFNWYLLLTDENERILKINSTIQNILRLKIFRPMVVSCSANRVPLSAEIKENFFKEIFIDVGLCSASLGLSLHHINSINKITMINNSAISEQVVGQLLRTINPAYIEPALYCWHREESASNAKIDYIIQHGNQVAPIKVKAGATGSLKSLHLFMKLKNISNAVRVNSDLPTKTDVQIAFYNENPVKYQLFSIPFYLVGRLHQLLEKIHV